MNYKGTIISVNKNKATVKYKPLTSGCGGRGHSTTQDEQMREVTAINTINAKTGDTVMFTLPDIVDLFSSLLKFKKPNYKIEIYKLVEKASDN